jgi:hypothetical protein
METSEYQNFDDAGELTYWSMHTYNDLTGASISESEDVTTGESWRNVQSETGYLEEYTRACEADADGNVAGNICTDRTTANFTEGTSTTEYFVDAVHVRDVEMDADGTEREQKYVNDDGTELNEYVWEDEDGRQFIERWTEEDGVSLEVINPDGSKEIQTRDEEGNNVVTFFDEDDQQIRSERTVFYQIDDAFVMETEIDDGRCVDEPWLVDGVD